MTILRMEVRTFTGRPAWVYKVTPVRWEIYAPWTIALRRSSGSGVHNKLERLLSMRGYPLMSSFPIIV